MYIKDCMYLILGLITFFVDMLISLLGYFGTISSLNRIRGTYRCPVGVNECIDPLVYNEIWCSVLGHNKLVTRVRSLKIW
jgi:hypothetical protein